MNYEIPDQQEHLDKHLNFLFCRQRIAADTPKALEITELSRAHHLRSSIIFLFFSFRSENIAGNLFNI
jgi:hypothetical protein